MSERLKERRNAARLTLGQVEIYEGVTAQYLSQIETEKRKPNWNLLARLAQRYGTSADYILGLTNDPSPAAKRAELTPEVVTVASMINELPPAKRGAALAAFQAIIDLTQDRDDLDTAAAPAISQQESGGQSNLSVEKDTWLALLKTALSSEDYKRLEDSVNRGEMPTQAELTRLIEAGKHNPLPKGTERLNNHDLVN